MSVTEKATRLPYGSYLRVGRECEPVTGREFLVAMIMEEPPDGGWPDRGEIYRYDVRARVSVTAATVEALERLAEGMLDKFLLSRSVADHALAMSPLRSA